MALLFYDGLDNYDSWTTFTDARPISSYVSYIWNTNSGRFGGNSFNLNSAQTDPINGCWYFNDINLGNEIWFGRAVFVSVIPDDLWLGGYGPNILDGVVVGSADADIVVQANNAGTISIWRGRGSRYTGSTLLANTAPGVFKPYRWQWLETHYRVHPTTGTVEVWLDNQLVLSYTGNTKNSAATTANTMKCLFQGGMKYSHGANLIYFDDLYILDTTGPAPWNTRLGEVRIISTVPVDDVPGANTGTTTSGNTKHWTVVDELPSNSTDFVYFSSTADNLERFRTSNISSNIANIYAMQIYGRLRKDDAGTANIRYNIIANGSNFVANSNPTPLYTNLLWETSIFPTNPQTNQEWSAANVSGLQIGITTVA